MAPSDPAAERNSSPRYLTQENVAQTEEFIRNTARPIDNALFDYYFEDGTTEAVLGELAKYQNSDGGFGRGLEPDIRLSASSPHVTSTGLQYCTAVDADKNHPVIRQAVEYLVDAYESEGSTGPRRHRK